MRRLALICAVFLFAESASAVFAYESAPGIPACPASSPTVSQQPSPDGSSIYSTDIGCALIDSGKNSWTFKSGGPPSANYPIEFNGSGSGHHGFQVELKSGGVYVRTNAASCGTVWEKYIYQSFVWASAPGVPLTTFVNATTGARYGSMFDMLKNAGASQTLTVPNMPAGFTCWPDYANIAASNITLNVDGAATISNQYSAGSGGGKGALDIMAGGANAVVNGGTWGPTAPIRIENNATNPTLKNLTLHDCSGLGSHTSCILSGSNNATVTLNNVTVYRGGSGGDGQDHNVYVSANDGAGGPGDPVANAQITNLNSYDVLDGGWTLKMRPLGVNRRNHVTQSYIWCKSSGAGCEQNGVIDMPCGGNYLIDYSVLERGPGSDNWFIGRALEEPVGVARCPARAATNNFVFDHDYIIWDGTTPSIPHPTLICVAYQPGTGACGGSNGRITVPAGTTCTISNSVIVNDGGNGSYFGSSSAQTLTMAAALSSSSPCTDGGGNVVYADRAAMAAGQRLGTKDVNRVACGTTWAFPCLPRHM